MGWPVKNEGFRLYFERKAKSYILLDPEEINFDGSFPAVSEMMVNNDPARPVLGTGSVSYNYLYRHCKRVSWGQMPPVWQRTLTPWMMVGDPLQHRGLWRTGERDEYRKIKDIPVKDLPLYINKKWKFKSTQSLFRSRLKNG